MAGGRDILRNTRDRSRTEESERAEMIAKDERRRTRAERKVEGKHHSPSSVRRQLTSQPGPEPVAVKNHRRVYPDKMRRDTYDDKVLDAVAFASPEARSLAAERQMTAALFDGWVPADKLAGFTAEDVEHIHTETSK